MVFEDALDAAHYALELSALATGNDWTAPGLPANFNLRIALHCGPVYCGRDPVTQGALFTGPHTSRAARFEPITPPGQVYASSAFAAGAAARGADGIAPRYVGRTPLAKRSGSLALLLLGVLAGLSVSTAHVLPDAIFPDVIEWDELSTGRRQEGVYYGIKNFIRKLTGALAIFFALQMLGWFSYQSPPDGATQFAQSATTLEAIRFLTGPVGALLLIGSIVVAYYYPLTRQRHERILRLLEKRRAREASPASPALLPAREKGARLPS